MMQEQVRDIYAKDWGSKAKGARGGKVKAQ